MDLGLHKKVAIICGSSSGLGEAIAKGLAAEGVITVLCARNASKLEKVKAEIEETYKTEVMIIPADTSEGAQVEKVVKLALEKYGRIDILVNNTGGPPAGKFEELTTDMWSKAVKLLLDSAVNMTRLVLPGMKKRKWGRIINITSIAVKQPVENLMLSNSIRTAVVGFAKTLANEVAPYGVTVNNVLPGYTRTQRLDYLAATTSEQSGQGIKDIFNAWEVDIPMKRLGEPHEFADMVVFLASERASYVTGTCIPVDGGWIKGLL